jgi:hypothetical protein
LTPAFLFSSCEFGLDHLRKLIIGYRLQVRRRGDAVRLFIRVRRAAPSRHHHEAMLYAFDLLELDGEDLRGMRPKAE